MTEDYNRPQPGPDRAGEPGSHFPQDETLEGQGTERPFDRGGAPQAVDPGLADQPAGGPADRARSEPYPAEGGTSSLHPETRAGQEMGGSAAPGAGSTAMGAGASRQADGGPSTQTSGGLEQQPLERLRERWGSVQGAFVDDPKAAVVEADRLVAEVIYDLEQKLTRRREHMQSQWRDGDPDTEQLRQHLHGYRALFQRLVESGF